MRLWARVKGAVGGVGIARCRPHSLRAEGSGGRSVEDEEASSAWGWAAAEVIHVDMARREVDVFFSGRAEEAGPIVEKEDEGWGMWRVKAHHRWCSSWGAAEEWRECTSERRASEGGREPPGEGGRRNSASVGEGGSSFAQAGAGRIRTRAAAIGGGGNVVRTGRSDDGLDGRGGRELAANAEGL